jgi:hypothetical protein
MTNKQLALRILAASPIGGTLDALRSRGVRPATLEVLERGGLATMRVATMAVPKGLKVTWYKITAAGMAASLER